MKSYILITILLLAYGYINIAFANQLASPFLTIVLIYLVWKIWDLFKENKRLEVKLDEIKKLLEKDCDKDNENEKQ